MKFGKRLKQQVQETLPGWRDKFLSYKDLKKLVRLLSSPPPISIHFPRLLEADFVYLLNNELHKFNAFFMEQEEDFIIRHQELKKRIEEMVNTWGPNGTQPSDEEYTREMWMIRKEIVNFHGEMVLLENYSNINYTGLVKILKKYDKRTGGLLRMGFIDKVLQQPFFTTDLVAKLIKECESTMDALLFPAPDNKDLTATVTTVAGEGEEIFRNTIAALMTMQEIRSGSSTHSHYSLPPLTLPDSNSTLLYLSSRPAQ